VFPGAQHLNWMDKVTLHVIQMDSNFRSLSSQVSGVRVSNVWCSNSRALDIGVSEVLDTWVSEDSDLSPYSRNSLGDRRSEMFSGFRLAWALTWASKLLGLHEVDS
jgi:hypothetical protein